MRLDYESSRPYRDVCAYASLLLAFYVAPIAALTGLALAFLYILSTTAKGSN
jgi:hypothetical protein